MTLTVALTHRFPGFALDVAFQVPPGVTALFGPSGSGKSTIVNAVAGLLRPDSGRIVQSGRILLDTDQRLFLPPHQRRIGCVFQDDRLFPHLTVRQNLSYGRWFAPASDLSFDRIVNLLNLAPLLNRRPATLSGGERQRVAIGRALLANPQLLLMDEPLAALDETRKAEILPYLEQLRDTTQVPILYVSHAVSGDDRPHLSASCDDTALAANQSDIPSNSLVASSANMSSKLEFSLWCIRFSLSRFPGGSA